MICLKLATRTGSFQVDVDATPPDCGVANINYERKPLAVPGTWNTGTNYADSRYQLPRIDTPHSKHGRIRSQLPIDDHRFPRNRRHHNQPSTPRHLVSLGTPRHHPRVRQIRRLAPRDRRHQYPRTPSSTSSIVRACARPCTPAPTITHSNGSLEARNRSNAPSPQPPASAPPSAPQQPSRPLA